MAESKTTRDAEAEARRRAERAERRAADLVRVQATLAGDKGAFEELFTQYRDKVYGVVYGYVRNKDDALDITQDAFVKGFKKLSSFRAQASFFTWITQIAINLSIDHTRRRKRRKTISLEEHHSPERHLAGATPPRAPGSELLDDELRGRYEAALEQLSDKHRTVFLLHTVKELQYKEIAALLEISIGTVMSRLHYARKRLQGLLAGYLEDTRRHAATDDDSA